MRKITGFVFLGVLLLFLMTSIVFADLNAFAGQWVNTDPYTRGITTLNITMNDSQVNVQAWGKASPSDIDWGVVPGYAYAGSVSDNLFSAAQVVSATYMTGFSETTLLIRPQGPEQLSVEVLTRFTDNSGRANFHAFYRFRRGTFSPQAALQAPRQISPQHGSIFNFYPRTTTLRWMPVNGAASYTVEVDYFDTSWITERGQTYIIAPNLTTTSFTFSFVGAQPGRWRVWAVGATGQVGPKSSWWEFKYLK